MQIRAAREGLSLSDYLLREIRRVVDRPTPDELLERAAARRRPEASQLLCRFVLAGGLQADAATAAIRDLLDLPIDCHPGRILIRRAFELRGNVTVYDAVYLALAEALDRPLLTGDSTLSAVPGCQAEVVVTATHR